MEKIRDFLSNDVIPNRLWLQGFKSCTYTLPFDNGMLFIDIIFREKTVTPYLS